MMQTIFLSTVTAEFGPLRRRLANLTQRTKKCQVRHQDDFFHRGVKTLQKLLEEVQESDLVVHVIGAQSGWCIPADQAETFLDDDKHRHFEQRYPDVARQARSGNLPATQWEAWLGLYFGKRLISFHLQTPNMDDLQKTHLARLNQIEEHPDKVDDSEALLVEIVGSLITLGVFTQEDVRRPIHLPYPSIGTLFKGRDEFIQQLRTSLQSTRHHRATAITGKAVHGLGGVGKTRLAVEYAWQHADEYSAVLCVTADSPENLHRNLAELTGPLVLDLAEHSATEEEARVAAALRWLQAHPGWFLILDNVDTEEAVVAVEKLLAELRGGHVLITSRVARFSDVVEPLELDVLSPEDGATFLLEKTQPKGRRGRRVTNTDAADALQLANELDGLALAMEQAGAYIVQLRRSFAEYLTLWRSHKAAVHEWLNTTIQYAGPTNAPLRSVAVTWQTTIDQLGEQERKLLNWLAWFAPDPVPLSIFASLDVLAEWREPSGDDPDPQTRDAIPDGSRRAATRDGDTEVEWDKDQFDTAISNLADFSMLTWDVEAETVKVHRVVQEILRTRQTDPKANLTTALGSLNKALPDGNPGDVRTWPAWEPLRAHVAFAVVEGKRLDIATPTSRLMCELAVQLSAKALHKEAEALRRDALAIDEKHLGKDSTRVAVHLSNLALTLKATNRLSEAEPLMRRALAIDEQSYGAEHNQIAIDLNNLAQFLADSNRLEEAEPLMRRALAISEQSCGAQHVDIAIRLNNLAVLLKATNRLEEAEPLMRRALAIDEQYYGAEHPSVARDLNNLATSLYATNRFNEAVTMFDRVVLIFEKSYGENHPNVATALNNLATSLQATSRLAEAEPLKRRALAIDEQSYGAEHPNVARDLNNLAQLLKATNRLAEAEPLMRRALAIAVDFKRQTGHEHPNYDLYGENYRDLLSEMNLPEDEIEQRLREMTK